MKEQYVISKTLSKGLVKKGLRKGGWMYSWYKITMYESSDKKYKWELLESDFYSGVKEYYPAPMPCELADVLPNVILYERCYCKLMIQKSVGNSFIVYYCNYSGIKVFNFYNESLAEAMGLMLEKLADEGIVNLKEV